jgi:hypothetical protein
LSSQLPATLSLEAFEVGACNYPEYALLKRKEECASLPHLLIAFVEVGVSCAKTMKNWELTKTYILIPHYAIINYNFFEICRQKTW